MVTAKNKGVVALTGNWSKGELEGKGRLVSAKEILLFAQIVHPEIQSSNIRLFRHLSLIKLSSLKFWTK